MSTTQKSIKEIIHILEHELTRCWRAGEPQDTISWPEEIGVLLSYNTINEIKEYLEELRYYKQNK